MGRQVDVDSVIDQAPLGAFQISVVAMSAWIIMLDGANTLAIGFAAPSLAKAFNQNIAAFGPVFAIGLAGLVLGSLFMSPLGDRLGRKWLLVGCVCAFGVFSLMPAFDPSFSRLALYRFLTGLGLGGAMPSAIALTAEYSPRRHKAVMLNVMFAGFPLGAVIGGLVASRLLAVSGWQSIFYLGGFMSLVFVPIIIAFMPDSAAFLTARGKSPRAIAKILNRLNRSMSYSDADTFRLGHVAAKGGTIASLFSNRRGAGTLLLWIGFFCDLLIVYSLNNWLPAVMNQIGMPPERAVIGPVLLNFGGIIGGIAIGILIDRLGAAMVIGGAFLFAAISVAAIGQLTFSQAGVMGAIFFAGFFVVGAQLSMNGLAAAFYPTESRSTGIGWALGIGRIGSIIGPFLGGTIIALKWNLAAIFFAAAAPALLGSIAMFLLRRLYGVQSKGSVSSPQPAQTVPSGG